jgi:transcriptional regulator with XRE-family HTH domain
MFVEPSLGERVRHVHSNMMPLDGRKFAALLNVEGLTESTLAQWKARPQYTGQLANVLAISRACNLSLDWLVGESDGEPWSPRWREVRQALAEWAPTAESGERLAQVWRKVVELHPDVREDMWSAYLGLVEFEKTQPGAATYHISYDGWKNIRDGRGQPSEETLRRAAHLTGLPQDWFTA